MSVLFKQRVANVATCVRAAACVWQRVCGSVRVAGCMWQHACGNVRVAACVRQRACDSMRGRHPARCTHLMLLVRAYVRDESSRGVLHQRPIGDQQLSEGGSEGWQVARWLDDCEWHLACMGGVGAVR